MFLKNQSENNNNFTLKTCLSDPMLLSYSQGKSGALDQVDWEAWFNGVGMPPVKPE